ncbi:hypothetical protein EPICR_200043 [Candidatus Desulfarcum epimagneticum]|uniref:Uncharacterized protein n=1 Tax=uncultured Desulfobacteraceae bacterium TaxID=218296 RepID=A0A484HFK3_9BACT|nr:hypothetical protein EPICR_200043 [uncultured Desulfobacteraceae bacterium]
MKPSQIKPATPEADDQNALVCMKHGIRVDADRADCRDPEIYCKFRPSCLIWFMRKERKRKEKREKP